MRDQQQQQQQLGPSSLFRLRSSLAAASRMRRGIRSFCHGVSSTSTLHQLHMAAAAGDDAASSSFLTVPPSVVGSCVAGSEVMTGGGGAGDAVAAEDGEQQAAAVTLEQMILQLDIEEEAARKARRAAEGEEDYCYAGYLPRRMSCVGTSDHVLRSARDALTQYPRFSLDGRDAMYRASFSSYYDSMGLAAAGGGHRRASVCCGGGATGHCNARACTAEGYGMDLERTLRMPATVAGESVVWCKPGVVAKLMGLEAVPLPVRGGHRSSASGGRRKVNGPPATAMGIVGGRKQRMRRIGKEELEIEREALHGAAWVRRMPRWRPSGHHGP